jgi:hypothetical protein
MLRKLRQAGAGDSVIATISTHSAVDIGPTSDDAAPPPAPSQSASYGAGFPDLANMGYPFYGGGYYGGGATAAVGSETASAITRRASSRDTAVSAFTSRRRSRG